MAQRGRKRGLQERTPPGPKPDPPGWLSFSGRELWDTYSDTLNSLGLLEFLDAVSFGVLCDAIAAWRQMRDEFERDGQYLNSVGENGALQINPLCQMIAQQTKAVLQLAAEFGMTPRGRINLTGSLGCSAVVAENPMEALLREAAAGSTDVISGATAAAPKTASKASKPAKRKPLKRRKKK